MIVVTDTSVVLNLCLLGHDGLLPTLFGVVLAPSQVKAEFIRLAASDARFLGLSFPASIQIAGPPVIPAELLRNRRLHAGEIEAIALAVQENADAILMDERAGRIAATALGIRSIGIVGILIEAKASGLIAAIRPLLERLQVEAGFWISASLLQQALAAVNE